jgi:hypothetical protein
MATYPLLTLIYAGYQMVPWVIRSTANLLTPTSTCTLHHITIASIIQTTLSSLVYRAKTLCDQKSLQDELEYQTGTTDLQPSGYNVQAEKEAHVSRSSAVCPGNTWPALQNAGQTEH